MKCSIILSSIVVIYIALTLYHIPATPFTLQWAAESFYWLIFPIWTGIFHLDTPSLPPWILRERHSNLKVVEFFVESDEYAVDKFLEYADNPNFDDVVVILRNVWANSTTNKLRTFNNIDAFRQHANLDVEHRVDFYPAGGDRWQKDISFGDFLDVLEAADYPVQVSFDYQFLPSQNYIHQEYHDLLEETGLKEEMVERPHKTHVFVFKGNKWRSYMHSNFARGYFMPVSNSKVWRWVHKVWAPYLAPYKGRKLTGGLRMPDSMWLDDDTFIPYKDVTLNSGDLMYFSTWHFHQVRNIYPDKLGFAVGIRPMSGKDLWNEVFFPMKLYTLVHLPRLAVTRPNKPFVIERANELKTCVNDVTKRPWAAGFNGTMTIRYDFVKIDGVCEMQPHNSS